MIPREQLLAAASRLDERFGAEAARTFTQVLPDLVADLVSQWQLEPEAMMPSGATSVVLTVRAGGPHGGGAAVLKISPDREFLGRQAWMLRRMAPTGRVPVVMEHDERRGAVLMERVVPGKSLHEVRGRRELPPVQTWAELVADLHGAPTQGVSDRLAGRCEEMIERLGVRRLSPQVRQHVSDELWDQVVAECRSLVGSDRDEVLIHGDLHLGNVLVGSRAGVERLIAIDPKLCVGDRCFDLVDYVVEQGLPEEMEGRAAALARLVGVEPERLIRWSRVNAVVSAVSWLKWNERDDRISSLLDFGARI